MLSDIRNNLGAKGYFVALKEELIILIYTQKRSIEIPHFYIRNILPEEKIKFFFSHSFTHLYNYISIHSSNRNLLTSTIIQVLLMY